MVLFFAFYAWGCGTHMLWRKKLSVSKTAKVEFEFITWAWVQGHHQNSDRQWLPKWQLAVAATSQMVIDSRFFPLLFYIYINKQTNAHFRLSTNNENLGQPLEEQKSVVASKETQVMNSNSTSGVQDPQT